MAEQGFELRVHPPNFCKVTARRSRNKSARNSCDQWQWIAQVLEFAVRAGIVRSETCGTEWGQWRALNVKPRNSGCQWGPLGPSTVTVDIRPSVASSSWVVWRSLFQSGNEATYTRPECSSTQWGTKHSYPALILHIQYRARAPPWFLRAGAAGRMIHLSRGSHCCKLLKKGWPVYSSRGFGAGMKEALV